jgi:hypothetical protein
MAATEKRVSCAVRGRFGTQENEKKKLELLLSVLTIEVMRGR